MFPWDPQSLLLLNWGAKSTVEKPEVWVRVSFWLFLKRMLGLSPLPRWQVLGNHGRWGLLLDLASEWPSLRET